MPDFITLSCPSCGGKLKITEDIERFACAHCCTEHVVKRGEGIVSLFPVIEEVKGVRRATDLTAAELAIARIQREIDDLVKEKKLEEDRKYKGSFLHTGILLGGGY